MTKGGGGGQKSQKNDDIFYEWPLNYQKILPLFSYKTVNFCRGDFSHIIHKKNSWVCMPTQLVTKLGDAWVNKSQTGLNFSKKQLKSIQ